MITGNNGTNTGNVKVLFIGQCLQYGYQNVTRSSTFSSRTAAMLRARFPGLRFKFDYKFLYHPTGLKAILKHRMLLSPPDVLIINLPAMYTARPWRVNLLYETAPELVDTARSFMQKIEAKVKGSSQPQASTILDGLFAIRQPLSLNEYENTVEEALRECQRASSCSIILIGPGRFNVDTWEEYPVHSPELWSAVNQMVLRTGKRLNVAVVNAQDALAEYDGEVFIPNNHRWSDFGHEVVAREVEAVVASQVAQLGRNPSLRKNRLL